jgi:hypothetical protein
MNVPKRRLAGIAAVLGLAALAVAPVTQAAPVTRAAAALPTARALALVPPTMEAGLNLRIAYRRYALCAASNITPSAKSTFINGKKYTLGTGTCPIVKGWTVYNQSLQGTSPTVKGDTTIWSSFGSPTTFPQYTSGTGWAVAAPVGRTYTVGADGNTGMANFWGFPCVVTTPVTIGSTQYPMAVCAGPIMENIDNRPVSTGVQAFTDAPTSATIPVGLAKIPAGPLMGMESFFINPFPTS